MIWKEVSVALQHFYISLVLHNAVPPFLPAQYYFSNIQGF